MRTTKVLSITLPQPMLQEAQELARRENRTMSELVREALRSYQRQQAAKDRWEALTQLVETSTSHLGLKDEEDVVSLIHDFRREHA
jgi:metal-responsive CopG/Arc/MetJ family transcriptional regulator